MRKTPHEKLKKCSQNTTQPNSEDQLVDQMNRIPKGLMLYFNGNCKFRFEFEEEEEKEEEFEYFNKSYAREVKKKRIYFQTLWRNVFKKKLPYPKFARYITDFNIKNLRDVKTNSKTELWKSFCNLKEMRIHNFSDKSVKKERIWNLKTLANVQIQNLLPGSNMITLRKVKKLSSISSSMRLKTFFNIVQKIKKSWFPVLRIFWVKYIFAENIGSEFPINNGTGRILEMTNQLKDTLTSSPRNGNNLIFRVNCSANFVRSRRNKHKEIQQFIGDFKKDKGLKSWYFINNEGSYKEQKRKITASAIILKYTEEINQVSMKNFFNFLYDCCSFTVERIHIETEWYSNGLVESLIKILKDACNLRYLSIPGEYLNNPRFLDALITDLSKFKKLHTLQFTSFICGCLRKRIKREIPLKEVSKKERFSHLTQKIKNCSHLRNLCIETDQFSVDDILEISCGSNLRSVRFALPDSTPVGAIKHFRMPNKTFDSGISRSVVDLVKPEVIEKINRSFESWCDIRQKETEKDKSNSKETRSKDFINLLFYSIPGQQKKTCALRISSKDANCLDDEEE